jgi:hypothetical protein
VSRPARGLTQRPIQRVPGARSLGVKRLGRETDHLPPSTDQVKKAGVTSSLPRILSRCGAQLINTGTISPFF